MSVERAELETIEQVDPFDFPAPPGDWLTPLDYVHTYSDGGYCVVSELSMDREVSEGSPSAICALMATDQGETETAQSVERYSTGMSKDSKTVIGSCVDSVCDKLRNLRVLPVVYTAFTAKLPATQNQKLTLLL